MRSTGRRNASESRRVRRPVSVAMRGWYGGLAGANDREREAALARAVAGAVPAHHAGAVATGLEGVPLEAAAERRGLRAGRLDRLQGSHADPADARLALGLGVVGGQAAPRAAAARAAPGAPPAGAPLDRDRDGRRLREQVAEGRAALDARPGAVGVRRAGGTRLGVPLLRGEHL